MKNVRKGLLIQTIFLCTLILVVILGKYLAPSDPMLTSLSAVLQPPGIEYPFGTDHLGRCVLSRFLHGASVSVFSALLIVFLSMTVGTLLGALSGYSGGVIDKAIFRIVVLFQSFPSFLLAVAVAGVLGNGLRNGIIAMVMVLWTSYARMGRSLVAGIRNANYIHAARLMGAPASALLVKHIFRNMISVITVKAAQDIGNTILRMSALSFLGLGAGSSTPEWGTMISEARQCLNQAPWCLLFPGLALFLTVLCFNSFGDALRKKMEVR